ILSSISFIGSVPIFLMGDDFDCRLPEQGDGFPYLVSQFLDAQPLNAVCPSVFRISSQMLRAERRHALLDGPNDVLVSRGLARLVCDSPSQYEKNDLDILSEKGAHAYFIFPTRVRVPAQEIWTRDV